MDHKFFQNNFAELLSGAKQMQENINTIKAEIKDLSAVGESGTGLVRITMNGERKITAVSIDPAALADGEMLQDLILTAANAAAKKIEENISQKTQSMMGGNFASLLKL